MGRPFYKLAVTLSVLGISLMAFGQVNVLTEHNDVARTGANLGETVLNTSNVNVASFGKLFTRVIDGQAYGQPLYMSGVNIGGKVRNVIFAATMNDSLYCFDADDPKASTPLWHDSFINPPSVVPIPFNDVAAQPISSDIIGILSTPVIDPGSNTIFVVTSSLEGDPSLDSSYIQRLHAIDAFTGAEKLGSPVVLQAKAPGAGDSSDGQFVHFVSKHANQRPALLLLNGVVYIASASYSDTRPYHGWVLGYDAGTLKQVAAFCDTPNGNEGGIWMSGQGPAADGEGNVYLITGNGTFTSDPSLGNGVDYGDSIVKLGGNLALEDFFAPYNESTLSQKDEDLGSTGVVLIPGTNLILGGGKQGILYLVNSASMGHFNASGNNSQIVQSFQASPGELHGSPVFWSGHAYISGAGDSTKSFAFSNGKFNTTPAQGTDASGNVIVSSLGPGGILSLSADGVKAGTGILWAQYAGTGHGTVRAFDAITMRELWNSDMNLSRDELGHFGKFSPPTVANGKVYVSSFSNWIAVYGLLGNSNPPPPPTNLTASAGSGQVSLSWSASVGATSYSVKRSLTSGSGYVTIKSGLTATSYTDTAVSNGTTYYYVASASNANGESANSGQVSATPGSNVVTLKTVGDTYTHSTTPTSSYGLGPTLRTKFWSSTDQRRTYVKFDISSLSSTITSAKLRLYGGHIGTASVSVAAYAVADSSWSESATTWNTQPAIGAQIASATVGTTTQYYEWDVTSYVQAQRTAGASLVTIALQESARPSDGGITEFNSLQNGSNIPLLAVTSGANPPIINLPNGFNANDGIQLNGDASLNGTRLQVTEGLQKKIGTAFYATPVQVTSFHTTFSFQLLSAQGDGITFTIQGVGPTAKGQGGGALGYGELPTALGTGINKSVAIKFDLFDNSGEGPNSTGIFTNGAFPSVPAIDLTPSGVNLHSGDIFNATMDYNGSTLVVKVTDAATGASATQSYAVNIGSIIGATGYVGFTGSTGYHTAVQQVLSWVYSKG